MATVSLRTPAISPSMKSNANRRYFFLKKRNGSLQTAYEFINSPRQHHVQKSMFPLALKSMKISENSLTAFSPNGSVFQARNMSTSKIKVSISEASNIENREMTPAPETAVSVFILQDNKILFGRRRSLSVAANTFGLPGGHLEFGESYDECAAREVKEETGLNIKNIELLAIKNLCYDSTHLHITYVRADLSDPNQTAQNVEPDKCEGWEWYDLKNLPEPMFGPLREMLQGGFNPFLVTV